MTAEGTPFLHEECEWFGVPLARQFVGKKLTKKKREGERREKRYWNGDDWFDIVLFGEYINLLINFAFLPKSAIRLV